MIAIRDLFLTTLVVLVMLPIWLLPWRLACRLGRFYGLVAFLVWGEGRRAGIVNLQRGLGMSQAEARAAVRTVFQNMAQSIVEALQFVRRYKRRPGWESLYQIEDPSLAERIISDPRPKIFVTAHLGSWEVGLMILQRKFGGGAGIARRVDNRWLDRLVKLIRLDRPSQWIEKRGGAMEAFERLKQGESVAMLIDENGGPRGPFAEFFGRPASTRKTPALLSLETGAPIVIGALVRTGDSFLYRLAWIDPQAEGLHAPDDLVPILTRINATLESWIRDEPLQWRWIHWRWKTRPDGTTEKY